MLLSQTNRDVRALGVEDGLVLNEDTCDSFDLAMTLDAPTLRQCVALRDWLMSEGLKAPDLHDVVAGIADRLNAMDVPVDRMTAAVESLHSEYAGVGRYWVKQAQPSTVYFPHEGRIESLYLTSPIYHVHQTREWMHLDLTRTPDHLFGIVSELKSEHYTHYVCVPLFFANGSGNAITFATRASEGFSPLHLRLLRFVMPTIGLVVELRSTTRQLDDVLRIYVGDEPHREILSGVIRRGQVSRIRSAILVADMRSYTRLTSQMTPEQTVTLLNEYFDYLVPPIEAQGGQVLKYMGDALLAIFRDRADDAGTAAQSALSAARDALYRLREARAIGSSLYPLEVGIALHHGEAAYGNVGSGQRLDFTVIGRDVNIACRVARLNKTLQVPLLMTQTLAHHIWQEQAYVGEHMLDGLGETMRLYTSPHAY